MKIDRSNYEIWFIDWLDGNLNVGQAEQLMGFLADNTDLREELNEIADQRLNPPYLEFINKSGILKNPQDLTDSQFEFLCAAYVENDLRAEELAELTSITQNDPERRNIFELFKKLKLSPKKIRFRNKKRLLKRTSFQKVIRLSVAGLSAAASVAILVISYLFVSDNIRESTGNLSELIVNEGRVEHSSYTLEYKIPESSNPAQEETIQFFQLFPENHLAVNNKPEMKENTSESEHEIIYNEKVNPVAIPDKSEIMLVEKVDRQRFELIPLSVNNQSVTDERWVPGKFMAKLFREKVLKEKTTDDSPIKAYEIAEAGVTGLNRLFGWEMAFEKTNDENGELKSVYFSSKILKIQAPVNKTGSSY